MAGTTPISSLANGASSTASAGSSGASSMTSQLGPDAFLQLLTTQLKNQDPLQPMDDTQSVAQLAQFSALQASQNLETSFANFQSNFAVLQSASLIGKHAAVNTTDAGGNSSTVSGTITSIQVVNGQPMFTMVGPNGQQIVDSNGKPVQFTTSQITGIGG